MAGLSMFTIDVVNETNGKIARFFFSIHCDDHNRVKGEVAALWKGKDVRKSVSGKWRADLTE
jgi:hypothetical protein